MRRYGWEYGGRGRRRGVMAGRAWLADPVEGRAGGYDRIYGEMRGARYGDRYDQGYVGLSETHPLARQFWREDHGLAPGSWRRACRRQRGYDRFYGRGYDRF